MSLTLCHQGSTSHSRNWAAPTQDTWALGMELGTVARRHPQTQKSSCGTELSVPQALGSCPSPEQGGGVTLRQRDGSRESLSFKGAPQLPGVGGVPRTDTPPTP